MNNKRGFALPLAIIAIGIVLIASAFIYKREALVEMETATTTGVYTTTSTSTGDVDDTEALVETEKPKKTIPPQESETVTVTPDKCGNRCAANEECRKELACAPCAPNTPPEYGNLCTCETVYNCVLR